jgi:flagellar basal body-associated protein FliL
MAKNDKENDEKEIPEEVKPASGGKKFLIIGLSVGLLIGGGAAAAVLMFLPKGDANIEAVETAEEEEYVAPELRDYQYAKMDKLQLPLIHNGRVLNYVVMDISMEVIGTENKMVIVKNTVIIRDELIRHFSENSVGQKDNPRTVDYNGLSEKIIEIANAHVHQDMVKRGMISQSRLF